MICWRSGRRLGRRERRLPPLEVEYSKKRLSRGWFGWRGSMATAAPPPPVIAAHGAFFPTIAGQEEGALRRRQTCFGRLIGTGPLLDRAPHRQRRVRRRLRGLGRQARAPGRGEGDRAAR